jgi:amidase
MKEPLHRLAATRLAKMIADGEVTSEVVARSFIDAVHAREHEVRAFEWFDADHALAQACELDRQQATGTRRGPLHGLPVAIKDVIDTAEMPTAYGSPIYARHRPLADAAVVALLKHAGAHVFGKSVTTEMATFTPGPTRNPHNLAHTPGGSSSGSAAAVAAHFCPLALGTQTAGSVIRPASFCGVAAYKPTPRLIPRSGVKATSDTLDEVGAFARTVEDLALVASVLALRPAWQEIPAQYLESGAVPTIAWTGTPQAELASPALREALERAAQRLLEQGAKAAELTWPRVFDGLFEAQRIVQVYETARALGPEYEYRRGQLSARLAAMIEQGQKTTAADYVDALQLGRACSAAIDSLFGAADVVLTFGAPGEAPKGLDSTGDPLFNRPWQLLRCPSLNVPFGTGEGGLPLGIQVVARAGDDAKLFAAGAWIEARLRDKA